MNAPTALHRSTAFDALELRPSQAIASCALCGCQRQFHGRGECQTFTPLPNPSAWHQTPRVRGLIADMKMLATIGEALRIKYEGDPAEHQLHWAFGELEMVKELGVTPYFRAGGMVGDFLDMIEAARDLAVTAEVRRQFPEPYSSHAERFDDFAETIDAHLDSVARAVEA